MWSAVFYPLIPAVIQFLATIYYVFVGLALYYACMAEDLDDYHRMLQVNHKFETLLFIDN